MRKDKTINLITQTETVNEIGDSVSVPAYRKAFAEKKSISQSEFYQAAATGLKPELTFVIWTREYKEETEIEYPVGSGKTYTIIRTFEPNSEEIELKCQGLV